MRVLVWTVLAAAAASGMVAAPAQACPGAEGTLAAQQEALSPMPQEVVLAGVVKMEGCPVEAQQLNCTGRVLVTTDKDGQTNKFMILKSLQADQLFAKVKEESRVEVTGYTGEVDGRPLLQVKSYRIPAARS